MAKQRLNLSGGWEVARTLPDGCRDASGLSGLEWRSAQVPGTVAGAGFADDPDAYDWWFCVAFQAQAPSPEEEVILGLEGLATVCDVYLNGILVLTSESMFALHLVDVGKELRGQNELAICCRALTPRLGARRRPRARWRTRLVAAPNLRFYRTMLLGRAPGFAPGPAVVGPWRPVWLERRSGVVCDVRVRAGLSDGARDGAVTVRGRARALPGTSLPTEASIQVGERAGGLSLESEGVLTGEVPVPAPALWWPHTCGHPTLHEATVTIADETVHRERIGFRSLIASGDIAVDGLDLRINDVPVFARGAVWTPTDLRSPHSEEPVLRALLEKFVDAGMNMLRVAGVGTYESDAFYTLCDELGILVWQDFMFANLDYPEADPDFLRTVRAEADHLLRRIGSRACLAALCGGSEVAQQVAMLGLDPALAQGPLYAQVLSQAVADAGVDAPYIPSSPWGGDLPFRSDRGIAHYYGVGAYRRPLEDARRSEVRFAAECLAFANVPDDAALSALAAPGGLPVHHPLWKTGVPRDMGAGWDFDDVRDHYFELLLSRDPTDVRWSDPERYLELSRMVSGEVMAETFGEWRRGASGCHGALVLWFKDLAPGAGWGVLDHRGQPKVAYHHLRRALAPLAVWTTDEGLAGVGVHVANDRAEQVRARLRVSLYRGLEILGEEAVEDLVLEPRSTVTRNVETMLGHFVDASWAYRFGPPGHDLIVASLERVQDGQPELLSQSFRFPAGRPLERLSPELLALSARREALADGRDLLRLSSSRFAYGVRIRLPGWIAEDDAFGLEPGRERVIFLKATERPPGGDSERGSVTALNLDGQIRVL